MISKLLIRVVTAAAALWSFNSAAAPTLDVTLQLRWVHQFEHAGYYAALHKGFYEEEGLRVTLREGAFADSPVSRVLSGHAQFGVAGSGELLGNYLAGQDVVMLAPIFQRSPTVLLVTGSNAAKISDLVKSKKPIQLKGGMGDLELQAMFLSQNITPDKLDIVNDGPHLRGLLSGELTAISAYVSNEVLVLEDNAVPYTMLHPQNFGLDFYGDSLFTSKRMLKDYPYVTANFRRASLRGWEYAIANKEEIVDIILKHYNHQNKTREQLLHEADVIIGLIRPEFVRVGDSNAERWNYIAETLAQHGAVGGTRDLTPFLYAEAAKDYEWLRWVVAVLAVLLFLIAFRFLVLYNANRRLKDEIQVNQEIKRDLHAKQYQLEQFSKIIDEHIMLMRVDLSENIVGVTRALLEKTGFNKSDIYKHRISQIFDGHQANMESFRNAFRARIFWRGEARVLRRDGSPFWADVSVAPTLNETGEVIEMTVFFMDASARKSVEELSRVDGLTGLLNRRTFLDEATRLMAATPSPWVCVAMIDADFFKRINDTWGHLAGDRVLQAIAREMVELQRSGAAVTGRFGGEEFLALFPCLDPMRPVTAMHQFMQRVRALQVPTEQGTITVTVSIGLEAMPTAEANMDRLLNQADQALYQAKLAGRDRMCFGRDLQAEQNRRHESWGDGSPACTADNPWPAARFRAQQQAAMKPEASDAAAQGFLAELPNLGINNANGSQNPSQNPSANT